MVNLIGGDSKNMFYCSFCGKSQYEVCKLIVGFIVFICDECVELCMDIICEEMKILVLKFGDGVLFLCEICNVLDDYVIGQEYVKCVLFVVVYNYYKWLNYSLKIDIELVKLNILLIGFIGCGKMLLVQMLVCILDVFFIMVDVIMLIEVGYVGEDVENIILKLLQVLEYNVECVQCGIVYIDEVDKIICKFDNFLIICDVLGEGVQQVLLKIMEGMVVLVLSQGGCKYLQQEFLQVDIMNILFICGGVFVGLDRIIVQCNKGIVMGFGVVVKENDDKGVGELFKQFEFEDLLKFGLILEFVGCLLVIVMLGDLDEGVLILILIVLKNVLVKQYQWLFDLEDVKLIFIDDVLVVIVCCVIKCKIGVCGLCLIMEDILLDSMFDLLGMDSVFEVVVNEELVDNLQVKFLLIYVDVKKEIVFVG